MTLDEKLARIRQETTGEVPEHLQLLLALAHRGLDVELNPAAAFVNSGSRHPYLAAFSDLLREFGGNTLLNIVRGHLPIDSARASRARAPLPICKSGTLDWVIALLLKALAGHGPAGPTSTRSTEYSPSGPVTIKVQLVETVDGVSLTRALGHDQATDTITGFVEQLTDNHLQV